MSHSAQSKWTTEALTRSLELAILLGLYPPANDNAQTSAGRTADDNDKTKEGP